MRDAQSRSAAKRILFRVVFTFSVLLGVLGGMAGVFTAIFFAPGPADSGGGSSGGINTTDDFVGGIAVGVACLLLPAAAWRLLWPARATKGVLIGLVVSTLVASVLALFLISLLPGLGLEPGLGLA